MIDQVMNSIYLRKYLRSNFEGTITKPLTRVEGTITKPLTRVEGTITKPLTRVEGTITKTLTRVEGTITKTLTRVGKHVYPIISSKYEHSVNIPYTTIKKQKSFACSSHLILMR